SVCASASANRTPSSWTWMPNVAATAPANATARAVLESADLDLFTGISDLRQRRQTSLPVKTGRRNVINATRDRSRALSVVVAGLLDELFVADQPEFGSSQPLRRRHDCRDILVLGKLVRTQMHLGLCRLGSRRSEAFLQRRLVRHDVTVPEDRAIE